MGEIKRKQKLFVRPRNIFDSDRISSENVLIRKYGLKNKKEIWKTKTKISEIRRRAKNLIAGSAEEQAQFIEKLNRIGLNVKGTSDVLALTEENLLDRRLQTFVYKKGFANTPKQSRQLIVHKHVLIEGNIVNSPGFLITKDLEDKISVKEKKVKEPAKGDEEEKKVEEQDESEEMTKKEDTGKKEDTEENGKEDKSKEKEE